jgi:hypothetical protein
MKVREVRAKNVEQINKAIEKAQMSGKTQRVHLKIPEEAKHIICIIHDIEDYIMEDEYHHHIEMDNIHYFAKDDFLLRFNPETLILTVKIVEENEVRNLIKKWLMRTLENLYGADTNWSACADWYIMWIVDNDFKLDTFESFVDYIYLYNPEYTHSIWDFFYGWGSIKNFMVSWVDDHEQIKFVEWLRKKNPEIGSEILDELEQIARKNLEESQS